VTTAERAMRGFGHAIDEKLIDFGRLMRLTGTALGRTLRRPARLPQFAYQVLQVGVHSLALGIAMSVFAGMVLAFQFGIGLERFGAKLYIGQVTVTAIFRELGPILTALVVGARVGAGIAAELGGMVVTEQIDAVRALGADPLTDLVAPRIVACTLAFPLLTVVSDVIGVAGGMLVASLQYGVGPQLFLHGVYEFVTLDDFFSGLVKTVAFGFIVGAIGCHQGMRTTGGTEGVGRATTRAVVAISLTVLAADFFLTKLLVSL
jgi:phospholipid/cholesterol/gamma-HCH transport system permease protein